VQQRPYGNCIALPASSVLPSSHVRTQSGLLYAAVSLQGLPLQPRVSAGNVRSATAVLELNPNQPKSAASMAHYACNCQSPLKHGV